MAAPREAGQRAEVVRRRLAYEADPDGFAARFAADEHGARGPDRGGPARPLPAVVLPDAELDRIARVCLAYGVDGMRADIVVARCAVALAAWHGRDRGDRRRRTRRGPAGPAAPAPQGPARPARHRRAAPRRGPGRGRADETTTRTTAAGGAGPDGGGPDGGGPGPTAAARDGGSPGPDRSGPDAARPGQRRRPGRRARRGRSSGPGAPGRDAAPPRPEPTSAPAESAAAPHGGAAARPGSAYRPRTLRIAGRGARAGTPDAARRRSRAVAGWSAPGCRAASSPAPRTCPPPCAPPLHRGARHAATSRPCGAGPAGGRARRARGQPGAVRRRRLRVDGRAQADDRGQDRRAVAAARRLPAAGPDRHDHLPGARRPSRCCRPPPATRSGCCGWRRCAPAAAPRSPPACAAAAATIATERRRDPRRRPLLIVVTDGRATSGPDPVPSRPRWPGSPPWWSTASPARSGSGLARRLAAALDADVMPLDAAGAGRTAEPDRPTIAEGPPDAAGQSHHRSRRRAHHPAAPPPGRAGRAHRTRQGQVDRRVRDGVAGLERRLADRGLPVRQVARSGGSARRPRSRRSARSPAARPVAWHKMGEGWSWIQRAGTERDHAAEAAEGWAQIKRDLAAETLPVLRARRVHLPDEVGLGRRRRRGRHAGATGPAPSTW